MSLLKNGFLLTKSPLAFYLQHANNTLKQKLVSFKNLFFIEYFYLSRKVRFLLWGYFIYPKLILLMKPIMKNTEEDMKNIEKKIEFHKYLTKKYGSKISKFFYQ